MGMVRCVKGVMSTVAPSARRLCGPFEGRMILVRIYAHSKFIDARVVNAATTVTAVTNLRQSFAMFGLPVMLMTDNGLCFTTDDFHRICKGKGIKHFTTAPYDPAGNGLAERAVQTLKGGTPEIIW